MLFNKERDPIRAAVVDFLASGRQKSSAIVLKRQKKKKKCLKNSFIAVFIRSVSASQKAA